MLQYVSAILISHLLGKPPINILAKPLSVSVSLIIVVKKIKEIKIYDLGIDGVTLSA